MRNKSNMDGLRRGMRGFKFGAAMFLALTAPLTFVSATENEAAAIARGARLYDDWARELGASELHRIEGSLDKSQTRPERCVKCHGWDYRGKDGAAARSGASPLAVGLQGQAGGDPARIAQILNDKNHLFGEYLSAEDRNDLALFVAKGQFAMDTFIDSQTYRAKGLAEKGHILFQTVCSNCHGNDGQQIVEAQPLGDFARSNPWRALHTLLNGHPGGTMPALRVLETGMLIDTLAYAQTLPPRDQLASIVRGGRLYDTWYKENGRSQPKTVHSAYPMPPFAEIEARTTWRCKECHGWDYRGKDGVYGVGAHKTGVVGVYGMAGADPAVIAAKIMDAKHGYGAQLSPRDVTDLANFISRGLIDMDAFIDRQTLKAKGDGAAYTAYYHTICAACHGADGREVRTMPPLGRIAKTDPWRAMHGIINGHPGESMPALIALPREAASGILAYIQTLPDQKGGR